MGLPKVGGTPVHANSHNNSKVANDAMFAKAKWWPPEEKQNKKFGKRVK